MKNLTITLILILQFINSPIIRAQLLITNDSLITELVQEKVDTIRSSFHVPGAVLTVVKQGKVIYNGGIGHQDIEADIPVDPDLSKFRVASITKTFTALGIMQLVDQGLVELDADIRSYLPPDEYPIIAPYSFTIHDLLTHTSGMEHSSFRVSEKAMANPGLETFVKTSLSSQVFKPGEVFFYSNKGYGILGHIIEKASGMTYEEYIKKYILRPLDMDESTLYQHTPDNPLENVVQPYAWDDGYTKRERRILRNPAASNLNTTGGDMARFMMAMLDSTRHGDERIITSHAYSSMTATQFQPPLMKEAMAYGMMIENYRGYSAYNHGGGIDGFGSYYIIIPELELGLFMSESGGEENAGYAFSVIYSVLNALIPESPKLEKYDVSQEELIAQAQRFAGRYQLATVTRSTFERGRMLFDLHEPVVKHVDNGKLSFGDRVYEPVSSNIYREVGQGANRELGFTTDDTGQPKYMSERLYWTFEKISWWQSVLALRLALISGLLLTISATVMGVVSRKKKSTLPQKFPITDYAVLLLIVGFFILIGAYALDINLTSGTPIIYRMGLWMTTAGAIFSLYLPIEIRQIWSQDSKESKAKIWVAFKGIGILLLLASYARVNLIGLNYY